MLYAHQKNLIKDDPTHTGIWWGTGSGKTRTSLLLSRGETLVICPKTIKEAGVWERDYKEIIFEKIKRSKNTRVVKSRLTVMSKEEFRRDASSLPHFHTVIVDEAHTMLGMTPNTRQLNRKTIPKASQLYDELEAYLERTKPDRLYLLSATISKSPFTVWAAGRILQKW